MHWEGEQITFPELFAFLIMHCSEGQLCRLGAIRGLDLLSVTHAITHIITITWWHSRTLKDCAIDTPVVPSIPSSLSSASAPPPQSCSAPERSSQSSPSVSCCACCRPTGWAWRRRAGTELPGTQRSPCRWGWVGLGKWTSCTWTSLDPSSSVESALRTCLKQDVNQRTFRIKSVKKTKLDLIKRSLKLLSLVKFT